MKLTSQEEYGLRCILNLARRETSEGGAPEPGEEASPGEGAPERAPLTLGQIAEQEGLSTEYAGKLLGILGRAGLVESVRGRNGGYRLARPADRIRVSETLGALGGGVLYKQTDTCDRFSGDQSFCVHSNTCSIRSLWSGLQLLLDHVLSRTTLHDLVTTSERTMADWMRSRVEALTQLEVPEESPGAGPGSGTITVVGPRLQSGRPPESC
ncbi:MAG: RrF2 family transcriptional regulator [Candidatus Krumholzibacteriia bacterium]